MDSFVDKIAQKFGTNDVIRVNSEAEAKEMEEAKETIKKYEEILSEVRRLNLKCAETNEMTGQLAKESIEKLEAYSASGSGKDYSEDIEAIKAAVSDNAEVKDLLKDQEEFIHKENVRVYRNVQASIVEELKLQTEALGEENSDLKKKIRGLKGVCVATLVFSILSFAAVAAYIVLTVLEIL